MTAQRRSSAILEGDEQIGFVEVVFLKDRPGSDKGSFLVQEQKLLDGLAVLLGNAMKSKKFEKSLLESEQFVKNILDATPEIVSIYDLDERRNLYINGGVTDVLGYTKEEMQQMGDRFLEITLHPDDVDLVVEHRQQMAEAGNETITMEYRMLGADGAWCTLFGRDKVYARNDDGTVHLILSTAVDITDRKKAEEDRRSLMDQLSQSQKMDTVGRLAGGIAHDFNNALQSILGYTSLLLMEIPEGDISLREKLEAVQRAGEHSADLTRQLLAFASKQTIEPVLVDLNVAIAGILGMLKRLVGEDINVSWLPDSDSATIKVDPGQVNQILANLFVNAREAIDGVGNITIETHNISLDAVYVKDHPDFEIGEYVLLEVSDDGCGMDKELLEHLFEPFYTTRPVGKGTGLGLAVVYGIVEQNKGFINVNSEPGEGTTFKIYLRQAAGKLSAEQKISIQEIPRGHGEMILLVEDDPAVLKVSQQMLERLGYRVIDAATPQEAIEKAKKYITEITLLVTDTILPKMNGHDLAMRLHELMPELKCLYMSGYTAGIIDHHGDLDPGINFIQKPFLFEDVAVKVRQVIDSS